MSTEAKKFTTFSNSTVFNNIVVSISQQKKKENKDEILNKYKVIISVPLAGTEFFKHFR